MNNLDTQTVNIVDKKFYFFKATENFLYKDLENVTVLADGIKVTIYGSKDPARYYTVKPERWKIL